MLNLLLRRIILGLIGAALAAGAAGVSVIAAGFAAYALLRRWLSAPEAGGVTALVFAGLTILIVIIAPQLWKGARGRRPAGGLKIDGASLRTAAEAGLALLGAAAELRARRSAKSGEKSRAEKGRK